MTDFRELLSRLGNLHDCTVALIEWRPDEKTMGFEIADLYFNFEGLPDYPGPLAGRITLEGVEHLTIDFHDISGPLRINEFLVEKESQAGVAVAITFWSAGTLRVTCGRIAFPDVRPPPA